jgi:hypothetical protein
VIKRSQKGVLDHFYNPSIYNAGKIVAQVYVTRLSQQGLVAAAYGLLYSLPLQPSIHHQRQT